MTNEGEGTMDRVLAKIDACKWKYASEDPAAKSAIVDRLTAAAAKDRGTPITYSQLVDGIRFRLSNVDGGRPFAIDRHDWRDVDRALVGDFLGAVSADSYREGGFL